jgi:peptide/nickel transport system permease protein
MVPFVARRLIHAVGVLLAVAVFTFLLVHAAPGGPAIMTTMETTPDQIAAHRARLGLDQPLHVQFAKWMWNLVRGDFGRSFNDGRPVLDVLRERLPVTLLLGGAALVISLALALPAGIYSATHRGAAGDHFTTFLSFIGVSIPSFWFGIVLIIVFSVQLRWLPSSGMFTVGGADTLPNRLVHMIMPVLVLATGLLPQLVRYARSSMLEVLSRDYVRTARAKGLAASRVVYHHALRNALIPVVTVTGLLLPRVIGGAVITEQIFGWPGMGQLAIASTIGRDFPMVLGITVVIAGVVVATNLTVDLAYGWLDPRIRHD